MRVRLLALLSVAALFILAAGPASASTVLFDPPKSFYLALGDSLAFGYQQFKFNADYPTENPADFRTGYVEDFSAMLRNVKPGINTVNFGCPGESTLSFIKGPCYYASFGFRPHNAYSGSQLQAALDFLRDHPGQVSPITIDLGAADVTGCGADRDCIAAAISRAGQNMAAILTALRAEAPSAEIIVMKYYNPFAVTDPTSDTLLQALNASLAVDAAAVRAAVADAFTPFNLSSTEPATLCTLTLICTPLQDEHASDSGYLVIAKQFWLASDFARLSD